LLHSYVAAKPVSFIRDVDLPHSLNGHWLEDVLTTANADLETPEK